MSSTNEEDINEAMQVYYMYIRYTEKCVNRNELPLKFIEWYYLGRNGFSPSTYAPVQQDN